MFGRISNVRKVTSINRCRSCAFSAEKVGEKVAEEGAKKIPVTGVFSAGRGPISFASLAVTVVVGLGITTYYSLEKEKKTQQVASEITTTGKPALGGPWVLIDSNGIPKTDASYKGEFALYYFGFTFCPDICPSELVKVGKIIDELAAKKVSRTVRPIFISVDPTRDTVGQLRHYAKDFHDSFVWLTGTKEQLAVATRAYRVYFSKANEQQDDEEDYLVDHSIVLYLVNREGEFVDFFTQRTQVGDVVDRIEKHIKDYDAKVLATSATKQ